MYAIWFNVLPSDSRDNWTSDIMPDPRVSHFWDEDQLIGKWFPKQEGYSDLDCGNLAWDIFFLYSPDAQWDSTPGPLVATGSPIIRQSARLSESIAPLLTAN